MKLTNEKLYSYNHISQYIIDELCSKSHPIIGITGTSSVGKSTFTQVLKDTLEQCGFSVQVIMVDNYLKAHYKGGTHYWTQEDSPYLTPHHYDWKELQRDLSLLQNGKQIERDCYQRGPGWGSKQSLVPSDYYIVEGLFLDSTEAYAYSDYALLITLTAEDSLIRELRTERDAYYRENFENFTRTEEETEIEITNTLIAGKTYTITRGDWLYIKLKADGNYHATVTIL